MRATLIWTSIVPYVSTYIYSRISTMWISLVNSRRHKVQRVWSHDHNSRLYAQICANKIPFRLLLEGAVAHTYSSYIVGTVIEASAGFLILRRLRTSQFNKGSPLEPSSDIGINVYRTVIKRISAIVTMLAKSKETLMESHWLHRCPVKREGVCSCSYAFSSKLDNFGLVSNLGCTLTA